MTEIKSGSGSAFAKASRLALARYRGEPASANTSRALNIIFTGAAAQRNETYHQIGSGLVVPVFKMSLTPLLAEITGREVKVSAETVPHQQVVVEPGLQIYPTGPEISSDIGLLYLVTGAIERLPDVLRGKAVSQLKVVFYGSPQARFGRMTPRHLMSSFREGFSPLAKIHARSIEKIIRDLNRPAGETSLLLHGVSLGGPVVDELVVQLKTTGVLEDRQVLIQKVNPTQYPDDLKSEWDKVCALATVSWGMGREEAMARQDPTKMAYERSNLVFPQEIELLVRSGQLQEYSGSTQVFLKKMQLAADLRNLYRYLNRQDTHGVPLKTTLSIHDFSVFIGQGRARMLQAIKYGELPIITDRGSTNISSDSSHYANNYDFRTWVRVLNTLLS